MNQAEVLLSGIEYKIKILIQQNKALSDKLSLLEKQLEETEKLNKTLRGEVRDLEERIKTIRISQTLMTIDDKDNVHQKIDELVREINKSIIVFNRLE